MWAGGRAPFPECSSKQSNFYPSLLSQASAPYPAACSCQQCAAFPSFPDDLGVAGVGDLALILAINRERKHKYQFTQDEAPRLFSLLALEEKEVFTFQIVACPSNHQGGSPLYLETKTLTGSQTDWKNLVTWERGARQCFQ